MAKGKPADLLTDLLSPREAEVVGFAIEGCTDEQIAQKMDVAVSTVNSYWVRVRGKIGQISRTEIVSKVLNAGFQDERASLSAQVSGLTDSLAHSDRSLAQAQSDLSSERGSAWHVLALNVAPESLLVARSPGDVAYANHRAETMFGAEPGGLVGRSLLDIFHPLPGDDAEQGIWRFMEQAGVGAKDLCIDHPCLGVRPDGTEFRATIEAEGFDTPDGFMAVLAVRDFIADLDAIASAVRRALA